MSKVLYSKFLTEVIPYVPDCPEIAATNAVRNACIEFCDKSDYLLHHHDLITLIPNQLEYELDLPDETILARVVDAACTNMQMRFVSEDHLRAIYPIDWRVQQGRPQYVTQLSPNEVRFVPYTTLKLQNAVRLTLALRPTRDSTGVDSSLHERWVEHISFGARARLHDTPNQPYYNPEAAMKFRALFEAAIGEARIERYRGLTRANLRIRPPKLV